VAAMLICQESGRHVYLSREWSPCLFVKRLAAMLICQEIGRHVYLSREWPPCLFFKRLAAMFICQESGRHVYLSREWPTCLFVKRVADMFICQEIGRHAYFLIYRRHMIYFQHNTNKNIFLAILEISVTVFSSFFSFDIQFTDVRKDTMVYGKPDCYSFLYHESLIRSILFVSLFRKF
jgi:hypothetical protein